MSSATKLSLGAAHRAWVRGFLGIKEPDSSNLPAAAPEGFSAATWDVRHPDNSAQSAITHAKLAGNSPRHAYPVTVHLPSGFALGEPGRSRSITNPTLEKADTGHRTCTGGRWITVHPHGGDEHGHPVYICPNADGSHTVVSGAGGKLNGLRLMGVKSDDDYKKLAKTKREEKKQKQSFADEMREREVGTQQFAKEQLDKQVALADSAGSKRERERAAIAAVFTAQGIDPSMMEVPESALAGVDSRTADTIKARYHKKLYAYAKRVGDSVRDLVAAGVETDTHALTGDIGVGDLAAHASGGGLGYASPLKALSDDLRLSPDEKQEAVEGIKLRSLLDRSDMSLAQAKAKQEQGKAAAAARQESEAKVKDAVDDLAKQGLGSVAIAKFPITANVQTMGDAVSVLSALKSADAEGARHRKLVEQMGHAPLATLPKALLLPVKELSDDEAKSAIAADVDEDSRRAAMIGLVNASNDQEADNPKSLRKHLSVGQNAAFNAIGAAVDGTSIDPILHDVLGASGAAHVLAHRWRSSLDKGDLDNLRDVLAKQHIATQEEIANNAVSEANEYLAAAALPDGEEPSLPTSSGEIAAALTEHAGRVENLMRARSVLGVARGRLEAASALNEALMRGDSKSALRIPLGAISPSSAVDAALALGLTRPTVYDKETGQVKSAGEFDLHHDGKNAILTLHPEGLDTLAREWSVSPEIAERAERSRRIKSGEMDEAGYVPEGLSRRPVSSFDVEPLEMQRPDQAVLGALDTDTDTYLDGKVRSYVGAMLAAGREPAQVESLLRSEEFVAGLGLSSAGAARYQAAVSRLSPQWTPNPNIDMSVSDAARAEVERYRSFQAERDARYQGCLAAHIAQNDGAAVDTQQLPHSPEVADCAYVAALSDPRLRFAFHKVGDLSPEGRAAVRRYAYQNLLYLDPKADNETLLTPLSPDERRAYDAWTALSDTKGDPYQAIQAHWKAETDNDTDLFGDPAPAHPLATVDLGDDASVVEAARRVPKLLGYAPTQKRGSDGQITEGFTDLEASEVRPISAVASDARTRIRQALRRRFCAGMLGMAHLAESDFNPASVKTAGDRWAEYASSMGETNAYQSVQEFMQGDYARRFAGEFARRTGTRLNLAMRPVARAERHAVAMLPPAQRAAVENMDKAERAKYIKRFRGKWVKTDGGVKDKAELSKVAGQEGAALFAGDSTGYHVETERPTIGKAAEGALAALLPHLSIGANSSSAAQGLDFSGDRAPIQRAIKLIESNKRQGLNLGTGMGKSVTATGGFTNLKAKGKANRALFCVPSNIVGQFPAEIDKFRDPSVPLFHWSAEGASGDARRAALANKNLHIVITTPESLRGDIVRAVALHRGTSIDEAASFLGRAETPESDRFDAIHQAMDKAGYHFDYLLEDEAHRDVSRAGKPDALMQRVMDAVSAKSEYYVSSTAEGTGKNDVSESWSMLHRMDPKNFPEGSRDSFIRRYGRNTRASGLALQRVLEPYLYPERMDIGVQVGRVLPNEGRMPLTPEQQQAHDSVVNAYNSARQAKLRGTMDIAALRALSPKSFEGVEGTVAETEVGGRLNKALAGVRDARIAQIVNAHPGGAKENWISEEMDRHRGEPTVIFAHHLDTVKGLTARLKAEGHRVVMLTGEMDQNSKSRARLAFQPDSGEPSADIFVLSDAGAMGANLQRGVHQINVDVPLTPMVHKQREGRIVRIGQKAKNVRVTDLVSNTDYDQRSRAILADKSMLREFVTTPSASIDDSGLAHAIEKAGVRSAAVRAARKFASRGMSSARGTTGTGDARIGKEKWKNG